MQPRSPDDLENFWGEVFCEFPARIRAALQTLSKDEQAGVIAHLQRMAVDAGWSEGQRRRAQNALRWIRGDAPLA